jgi:hypothetical protein
MSENVQGQWTLRIGGSEWKISDEPSFASLHVSNEKVTDSSGRVAGNKQTVTVPAMSATVICTKGTFAKLQALITSGDQVVEAVSGSTGEIYTVYGARQSGQLTLSGHTCQINLQGDTSNP